MKSKKIIYSLSILILITNKLFYPMLRRTVISKTTQQGYAGLISKFFTLNNVPQVTNFSNLSQTTQTMFSSPKINAKKMDLSKMTDYEILGLSNEEPFTSEELKKAYRQQSKLYHPDTGGSHEQFLQLQEAFKKLNSKLEKRSNKTNNEETNYTINKEIKFLISIIKFGSALVLTRLSLEQIMELRENYKQSEKNLINIIIEYEDRQEQLLRDNNKLSEQIQIFINENLNTLDALKNTTLGKVFGKTPINKLLLKSRLVKQKELNNKLRDMQKENALPVTDKDLNEEFGENKRFFLWLIKSIDPSITIEQKESLKKSLAQKKAANLARAEQESNINQFQIQKLKQAIKKEEIEKLHERLNTLINNRIFNKKNNYFLFE